MMSRLLILPAMLLLLAGSAGAQTEHPWAQLDPNPYNPATEPAVDMFFSHWKDSMPRMLHGNLVVRDIFTPLAGTDPLRPERRGAVCTAIKSLSNVTLQQRSKTTAEALDGVQELYYVDKGEGVMTAGRQQVGLHPGMLVLVPAGLKFQIATSGTAPLQMFLMVEPVPAGFVPQKELVARDERELPISGTTGHWTHITSENRMGKDSGLATIIGCCTVWYDPNTIGQPHSHGTGVEEIWFAIDGDVNVLLGKDLRTVTPGGAYKIPADGETPHSNINVTDKPVKMFWLMYNPGYTLAPYTQLDPNPYNPAVDADIDMFMGNFRFSNPKHTHGSLIERDILTKTDGDPNAPTAPGRVLKYTDRFTYATLYAHNKTIPTTLDGSQEFFYILGGKGAVTGGGKTFPLYSGVCFLAPEGLEFTMENTGDDPLTMYLVAEPTPAGFRPNDYIYWNDEADTPIYTSESHWINVWSNLIEPKDGLAQMQLVLTVWLYPNTFAQPHSHSETTEEVWATVDGDVKFLMGKEIRDLPFGAAYMIPPNNETPHANFDITEKPIKFFYYARFQDQAPRP